MGNGSKGSIGQDFSSEDYAKRVDSLEEFKKEFEGKSFDTKVCAAVKDSVPLQNEVKALIWQVIKDKAFWIVGGIILTIASQFVISIIPKITDKLVH